MPTYLDPLQRILAAHAGFPWEIQSRASDGWLCAVPPRDATPEQGWKLHLSATAGTALDLLDRAAPLLVAAGVRFKIARSPEALSAMNGGYDGLSQVGKFMTVYPRHDAEALELAARLRDATLDLSGPEVPSDRRVRGSEVVSYRFGGFKDLVFRDRIGEYVTAVRDPGGQLVRDLRDATFRLPPFVTDIFEAAGLSEPEATPSALIGGRFLLTSRLASAARGIVFLAIDLPANDVCIVKEGRRRAVVEAGGDAEDRIEHEHAVLSHIAGTRVGPQPRALVRDERRRFLASEFICGMSLGDLVGVGLRSGRIPSQATQHRIMRSLCVALETLHERGIVFRDLKPTNIVVEPDLSVRLIDFETAWAPAVSRRCFGKGTPGFMSPEQAAGGDPDVRDDIYALGATLLHVATGVDPYYQPDLARLHEVAGDLAPLAPPGLLDILFHATAPTRAGRPATVREVRERIEALEGGHAHAHS